MRTLVVALGALLAVTLCPPRSLAQDVLPHEISFGFGGAGSFENSIFNIPTDDLSSAPDALMNMSYMYNLDQHWAVGFHFYETSEETGKMVIMDPSGLPEITRFTLTTDNFGVRGRYTFLRSRVSPYAYAGANLVTGTIESAATGTLDEVGFSVCAGPGATLAMGRSWRVSFEGLLSIGSAKWKDQPFEDSSGREFNPSIGGGLLTIGFSWGHPVGGTR